MVPKIEMTVKSAKIALETIETVDFHVNDDLKVLFILADHLEVLKQGKVILLKAGDIFLVNPGEIIGMVGSSKNRVLMLNIQLLEFEKLVGQFKLTRPLSLSYHHDAYKNLTKLLSRLYIEQMQKKKGYQAIINGCVSLVLGTLLRTLTIEPLSFNRTIDNDNKIKNREVMAYINEHHTEKLTLQKLADHFYVSKFYLAHRFKEDLGMSVGKYLKEIRLLYAIRQLETSHLSVGEIAINNGFPNVRSFSDVFKERNGMTPTEFRKKKPILFTDTPGIEESDVYQLLENYITIEEISELKKHDFELFNKSIDLSRVIGKMAIKNFVVKLNPLNLTNTTALKLMQLGVRYIAVEKIILKVKHNAKKEICFKDVTDIIDNILQQGFLPYIQLQTVDWEAIKPSEKAVFFKSIKTTVLSSTK
ncbi:bacterial regulatory helix-turn-helix s, AraC family protein [Brochothrix thermosphacta DSM 20171 = FSL F6-1036]|nr:bacterial regulatory helix-turn-helix s, AraC family protein [Brochothrix thermosphacta DSM 20171 = FSL F6-1036]